jgi:pimeloyl-ACP methyl ester carboxylesterase
MAETFVLVHGAWHGAWCWAAVINQLEMLGDRAYAVDLPGHGMNYADRSKVTLDDYVNSVAEFIRARDLRGVNLVGHSLGGVTIPGVAVKIPDRIKRVIWATAIVAEEGKSAMDPNSTGAAGILRAIQDRPDRSIPIEAMGEAFLKGLSNDMSEDVKRYVMSALCPQPAGPMIGTPAMAEFFATKIPSSYMVCTADQTPIDGGAGWHPHFSSRLRNPTIASVDCGHEFMFTAPAASARALHQLASA